MELLPTFFFNVVASFVDDSTLGVLDMDGDSRRCLDSPQLFPAISGLSTPTNSLQNLHFMLLLVASCSDRDIGDGAYRQAFLALTVRPKG